VPVLDVTQERPRPGGAGLAAALAAGQGRHVVLVTPLGDTDGDPDAARLAALLDGVVELVALPTDAPTTVKTRLVADGHPLARVDRGTADVGGPRPGRARGPLPWTGGLTERVRRLLEGAGAVLVADYGRGVSGLPVLRDLLTGVAARVPVVWDPHPRGAPPLPGARLATPNASEAATWAARLPDDGVVDGTDAPDSLTGVAATATRLVAGWDVAAVAVTLGARGALLSYGDDAPALVPAPAPAPAGLAGLTGPPGGVLNDTCGAGDCFAATVAGQLADGAVVQEAVAGAVEAASRFVAAGAASSYVSASAAGPGLPRPGPRGDAPGVAVPPVTDPAGRPGQLVAEVRARGGTVVATGGCFDLLHAGHIATLRAARALGDVLVVCVNSDESVRRLKGPSRPVVPLADRVRVLEALECVDAVVVFDEDTPERLLGELRPDVWAKGGDYTGAELPEAALLRGWGGQAVVLPYLPGRSTTRLVDLARAGSGAPGRPRLAASVRVTTARRRRAGDRPGT